SFLPFEPFDTTWQTTEPRGTNRSSVVLTVRRLGDVDQPASVRLQTQDGTARTGADYLPLDQVVAFAPFEQEKQIAIGILNNERFAPDQTFEVRLTAL